MILLSPQSYKAIFIDSSSMKYLKSTAFTGKNLFVATVYVAVLLVWCKGCQSSNKRVSPDTEPRKNKDLLIGNLGGIPNLGNTCYMNSVLQIIAKLYPDIFRNQNSALARAGQVIVDKIRDDKDFVTREEAEAIYTALLNEASGKFTRGSQESADECMDILWQHCNLPLIDQVINTPFITIELQHPHDSNKERKIQQLLDTYAGVANINAIDFINNVIPIKLSRVDLSSSGIGPIKINTVVKEALKLTMTPTHTPWLTKDLNCQLMGLIVHTGSASGGHYFSYINLGGQWKLYNDDRVKVVTIGEVEQAAEQAYLYFYNYAS